MDPTTVFCPNGTALPEAKLARAILVSIRRRNSGSSVTSAIKRSAPRKGTVFYRLRTSAETVVHRRDLARPWVSCASDRGGFWV